MTSEPVGEHCPSCKQPPLFLLGDQAFCGNDDCPILQWNPTKTMNELLDGVNFIDLPQPRQPSE